MVDALHWLRVCFRCISMGVTKWQSDLGTNQGSRIVLHLDTHKKYPSHSEFDGSSRQHTPGILGSCKQNNES